MLLGRFMKKVSRSIPPPRLARLPLTVLRISLVVAV